MSVYTFEKITSLIQESPDGVGLRKNADTGVKKKSKLSNSHRLSHFPIVKGTMRQLKKNKTKKETRLSHHLWNAMWLGSIFWQVESTL